MSRKLALITGGTSGIGLGIAHALAPEYDLALVYAKDSAKADAAVASFNDTRVQAFKAPLTNQQDCAGLFAQVCESFGTTPSILVNSAGRLHDGLFLSADFDEYIKIVQEHLIATMALTQLALKAMYRDKAGRIINLSSISATYSKRGQTNYSAAKGGIESFTKTLALEVAHRGITVNAIAPGLIETPMTGHIAEKFKNEENGIRKRIPAGRLGQPEEVGALAAFLCSTQASYITGAVITIDGGRSLGDPQS